MRPADLDPSLPVPPDRAGPGPADARPGPDPHRRLRALLRIDSGGGLVAGALLLLLLLVQVPVSSLLGLPLPALIGVGVANLAYGLSSGALLRATPPLRPRATAALATANIAWLGVCLGLLVVYAPVLRPLGRAHLVLEGLYVAALGGVELWALAACRARPAA
ncbi:MAG: hypothetical protein RL071_2497 [Pseudomonadota bacterium]